jgi:hypothetical protein
MPAFLVSCAPTVRINERLKTGTYIEARSGLWIVCDTGNAADLAARLAAVDRSDGLVVVRIVNNEDWYSASKIEPDVMNQIKTLLNGCLEN